MPRPTDPEASPEGFYAGGVSTSEPMGTIRVSAVVLRDDRGAVLTVRKRGSTRFMLPGGKPDVGESAAETAVREVREELSIDLEPTALRSLGVFRAAAANEPGFDVESTVFAHPPVPVSQPAAEIEELRWQLLDGPYPTDLAPLLAEHILPALVQAPSTGLTAP